MPRSPIRISRAEPARRGQVLKTAHIGGVHASDGQVGDAVLKHVVVNPDPLCALLGPDGHVLRGWIEDADPLERGDEVVGRRATHEQSVRRRQPEAPRERVTACPSVGMFLEFPAVAGAEVAGVGPPVVDTAVVGRELPHQKPGIRDRSMRDRLSTPRDNVPEAVSCGLLANPDAFEPPTSPQLLSNCTRSLGIERERKPMRYPTGFGEWQLSSLGFQSAPVRRIQHRSYLRKAKRCSQEPNGSTDSRLACPTDASMFVKWVGMLRSRGVGRGCGRGSV